MGGSTKTQLRRWAIGDGTGSTNHQDDRLGTRNNAKRSGQRLGGPRVWRPAHSNSLRGALAVNARGRAFSSPHGVRFSRRESSQTTRRTSQIAIVLIDGVSVRRADFMMEFGRGVIDVNEYKLKAVLMKALIFGEDSSLP